MDDLNANARALINAARSFDDPTDSDQDRVRTAVLMRVGSIAAVGTVAVTAAKASSAAASAGPLIAGSLTSATLFSGVAAKIGAVVVLGAIASGAYVAFRPARHPSVAPTAVAAVAALPVASPGASPGPAAEVAPSVASDPIEASSLPIEDVKPSPARVHSRAADLEGEMKLLRQADGALRRGDSAAALVALNKHAAQYPSGVLAQEREGVRAIALCSSGNTSAGQSAAQRFLSSASKSPLASRIRSACSLNE